MPGSLPRCIRVLVHWNTERRQSEIEHIYVRDAVRLRPDLSKLPPVNWDELEDGSTTKCVSGLTQVAVDRDKSGPFSLDLRDRFNRRTPEIAEANTRNPLFLWHIYD